MRHANSGAARPAAGDMPLSREGTLAGTWTLIRFILRRDRVRIPVWTVAVGGSIVGTALSYADTFPTQTDLDSRAELAGTPVFVAFNGPGFGLDNYTLGAMVAHETLYLAIILVALMSVFLTVRHTRAEEESGRAELVRSAVTGRHAMLASSLVVVSALNVVVGLLTAAGLSGIDRLDGRGSLTFGISMIAAGLVFTAVAAVVLQVTEYSRGAVGIGVAVLGASYAVRAVGDVSETGLSWLSPFAWSLHTRAYVDERWWPLLLSLTLAVVLTAAAIMLNARRDVVAGLMPARPGRPHASPRLTRLGGLPFRQQRAGMLAWTAGLALLGAAFGPLLSDIEEFVAENERVQEIVAAAQGATIIESFLGTITGMLALLATGFAVSSALRMRNEEAVGRLEPLLATGLPRHRWMAGYLIVMLGGSMIVMLAGSLTLGVTASIDQRDPALVFNLLAAGVVHMPAIWVVAMLAVALFGVLPRLAPAAWLVLGYGVIVSLLGPAIGLEESQLRNLSPFDHVPELPGAEFSIMPVVILSAIAVGLALAGLAGFRRRDLHAA
ncbi:ABC transporter permease [Phytoactinopolyspora halotolerans]|uniref:ABC transporter permease n=1 Tax=Phytoactinopolyspora halotolerans TaxID=1981512 RepID=A0A6L9S7L9_9ACTN|nr:ABC transporter permease [Phytoactinopolyspora halotolerans]NEE01089.1 ABC transporter permease [Phytoactinopolyspora halotolerans]